MDSTDRPSEAGDGAGGGSDEEFFQILTEFEAELRAGNVPSVEEWAERHPEHGEEIRELFPGVLMMECTASGLRAHEASEDLPDGLGPYEIKRVLGRGGMGTVYLAWDPRVGREVALKVLHSSWQSSQKSVDRFIREVKAAGGLRHPNIVPVFGSGQAGGVPYYAMQYVEGVGLDDCIGALAHVHPSGSHSLVSSDVQTLVSVVQGRRGMIP
ncbi:MAG: protein kinase, partial [Planctomycetota bacterium]|nr:protein kinase [Planctomycetota bacterium]